MAESDGENTDYSCSHLSFHAYPDDMAESDGENTDCSCSHLSFHTYPDDMAESDGDRVSQVAEVRRAYFCCDYSTVQQKLSTRTMCVSVIHEIPVVGNFTNLVTGGSNT